MSKYGFRLLWSEEDQGFIATCPDFPGLSAFGETPNEALHEAQVALDLFVESLSVSDTTLPEPTQALVCSGQVRLRMPKNLHYSLVQNAENEGVSLNTWIVTLLSKRNSVSELVSRLMNKMEAVKQAIEDQSEAISLVKISKTMSYKSEFSKGEQYENIRTSIN